jgi:hypothetical protein
LAPPREKVEFATKEEDAGCLTTTLLLLYPAPPAPLLMLIMVMLMDAEYPPAAPAAVLYEAEMEVVDDDEGWRLRGAAPFSAQSSSWALRPDPLPHPCSPQLQSSPAAVELVRPALWM